MWPVILRFDLFGAERVLSSFGLFVAGGFLVGVWVATRLAARWGENPDQDPERVADVAWWTLIGIVAGGRLAYVLVNWEWFAHQPWKIFAIWEGGLVMYGGLILALVLGTWKARSLGMNLWAAADWGLTAGFLGQAIGRIGCLMVGDDFGKPTDLPWGLVVPNPLPEGSLFPVAFLGERIHPTQIYMSLKALALFGLGLWLLRHKRFHGQVCTLLLAGYAILRFVIEFFRGDDAARGGIFLQGLSPEEVGTVEAELFLSTSQMVGMALLPLAFLLYVLLARRGRALASSPHPSPQA